MFENLTVFPTRLEELQQKLADPAVAGDRDLYARLMKEYRELEPIVETYTAYRRSESALAQAKDLLETEKDPELHALAQELGVTVIGLSQVTVPETDKKGRRRYISKEDLRESRQLKQDADVILLLDLMDPTDRNGYRVLQIEKNRDGPLAHMVLSFDPSRMRFSYVEPPESDSDRRSRERYEKMDAKREAQREKELRAEEQKKLQGSLLEGWTDVEEGDLPFV